MEPCDGERETTFLERRDILKAGKEMGTRGKPE